MELTQQILSYKNRRVLVTGDTGFKGSWLSLWLKELEADVVGYALPPEREIDHFNLIRLDKLIHHIDGDIRDIESLRSVMEKFQPEIIFHLAAQPLVRASYKEPKLTFDTNVGGSVNVLEAVRLTPSVRVLIYITSDKCYKNKEWIWGYRENDELGGQDPYSASKAAAELVFFSYTYSYFRERRGMGAATVRAGNVIGGGDWAEDRIVPDCIKALQNNKQIILRNPMSTRPWQHVLDPLSGYLLLGAKLLRDPDRYGGAWNFGPETRSVRTVQELAETIIFHWGKGILQKSEEKTSPSEAQLLCLNCDKAHQILDWRPRWSFTRSLDETVKWYKKINTGTPALQITRQQINNFMEELND
ncbi:MAG: CDP-glucose 4,6-dehydratase [Desulfobacterales bacterium]|nr:CDP-glucose 4,6-dehydratase [Desulfobacterales bacterium]